MSSKIISTLIILTAFILVFGAVSCSTTGNQTGQGRQGDTETNIVNPTGTEPPAPETRSPSKVPLDAENVTPGSNTVDVSLMEYEIDMPETIERGLTTFIITNQGTAIHNFEIEGQGIEEKLDEPLDPGQTGQLEVSLIPGTYRVYCPVSNHAQMGMDIEILVSEAAISDEQKPRGTSDTEEYK